LGGEGAGAFEREGEHPILKGGRISCKKIKGETRMYFLASTKALVAFACRIILLGQMTELMRNQSRVRSLQGNNSHSNRTGVKTRGSYWRLYRQQKQAALRMGSYETTQTNVKGLLEELKRYATGLQA
jgi:hypothetical protein